MGEVRYTSLVDMISQERLHEWYSIQAREQQPISYLLPSMKWLQAARKAQPGLVFQTFDDLAVMVLEAANVNFHPISDEERTFCFYEILNQTAVLLSEKELFQKAKAYADSYGQLKRLGLTIEELPDPLIMLQGAFSSYEREYRDEMGLLDQENRIGRASEWVSKLHTLPFSHVVIEGFSDFSPVQYLFLEALTKAAIPCTVYLPDYDAEIIHETAVTLNRLGIKQLKNDATINILCKQKTFASATTIEEEIHGVLDTIAKHSSSTRYRNVGIVLANEQYLPELERISELKQIPIKKAKKRAIAETLLFSFLHIILVKPNITSKWDKLPHIDVTAKLLFTEPNEYNHLKDSFIQSGDIEQDDLKNLLNEINAFQARLPEEATISQFTEHLHEFFEQVNLISVWKKIIKEKTSARMYEAAIEMRAFQRLKEIIERKREEGTQPLQTVVVPLATFKDLFLSELEQEELFLERAPVDGIEIYTFRDVPLFNGTDLFVMGLNEGEFPKQMNLSGYFQERYLEEVVSPFPLPLPDYFRKKDDAAFAQLIYLAERLHFSYVEGMNPHQPLLPSKYVMDMPDPTTRFSTISRLEDDTFLDEKEYEEKRAFHIGLGFEVTDIERRLTEYVHHLLYLQKGEELLSTKWTEGMANTHISITSLESYAKCSFQFGLARRLNIKEPLEKKQRIDPIETGNMLHRIIEQFYHEAIGVPFHRLTSFFEGKEEEKLERLFEKEWKYIEDVHSEIPFHKLEKEKRDWWKKLRKWLAAEKTRFWQNESLEDMTIFKLEEPVQLTLELGENETLTLRGKIDRVDIDEDGFVIYDYKSSFKELDFEKEIPGGLVLQIPLYMIALEKEFKKGKYQKLALKNGEAIGGGYISIKEPHVRKKNTVWKDEEQKKRFESNNRVKTNLIPLESEALKQTMNASELVGNLWHGSFSDFSVKPFSSASCKYCPFKSICRVTTELQEGDR